MSILQIDLPAVLLLVEDGRNHPRIQPDMPAQIELVGYVIKVALVLRLTGKMFLPVPFLQQFLGERISIGVALGVETASRIPVPKPGAAHSAAGLEGSDGEPALSQTVQRVQSGNPGSDDNRVELLDFLDQVCTGCWGFAWGIFHIIPRLKFSAVPVSC